MSEFKIGEFLKPEDQEALVRAAEETPQKKLQTKLLALRELMSLSDPDTATTEAMAALIDEVLPQLDTVTDLAESKETALEAKHRAVVDKADTYEELQETDPEIDFETPTTLDPEDMESGFSTVDLEKEAVEAGIAKRAQTLAELIAEQTRDAKNTATRIDRLNKYTRKLQKRHEEHQKMSPETALGTNDSASEKVFTPEWFDFKSEASDNNPKSGEGDDISLFNDFDFPTSSKPNPRKEKPADKPNTSNTFSDFDF